EFSHLKKLWYKTAVEGRMRTVFSLLYSPTSLAVSSIRDAYTADLEGIETDDPAIAEEIRSYLNEISPGKANDVCLYDDKLLPLYKCISLEKTLDEICQKKVWLKSGGFLVIEQTEAFVSIDVNTGKYTDKKKAEETYRKINLEAADEIGRQLRLRNLSGIIMVDFINMENQDHVDELFHVMKKILKKDTVPAKAVDITALGIMEITRKKVRRPVIEEL
ncbi:MAG: ribonuclease E/G, partial [Clostridiales bacterium]|nr:ribonuclease E/G [Candidatus Blautia equi]